MNLVSRAKIGLLWRGERGANAAPTRGDTLLGPLLDTLAQLDVDAHPLVYSDDALEEVRAELLQLDGVLVWVNPIDDGRDRVHLDALLREAAARGIWVSAHPDTILRMGTKEVLFATRSLGWGADTDRYESTADFLDRFPARLAADGVRVLKQHRGNGGQGVWRIELIDAAVVSKPTETPPRDWPVRVQHADKRDPGVEDIALGQFVDSCGALFSSAGPVIDQAFQSRLPEGMVRCYLVQDEVVGFCHQWPKGLLPPTTAPIDGARAGSPHVMEPASAAAYNALKHRMEIEWVPEMKDLLGLDAASLPVIWDADFLYGRKTPAGEDTYVLCEINVSAVWPYPETANRKLAEAALAGTIASKITRRDT